MVVYLILGATYAFAAAVQPGALQTYLISQTLSNGWRRTLPAALSPLISDGPIIVLVLLVLSRVPAGVQLVLQCVGGIFLLYLAADAWKTWRNYAGTVPEGIQSPRQSLLRAAVVNLLNPNPYLGWSLVLGPLLLKGWHETPAHGIALVAAFYLTMILTLAGIIMLFAAARNLGPRVSRALIGASAIGLACFGLYQLWSGTRGLW
ncbi:MAG: LysE family transporter [Acidobacteriia bacterium]|nr:LysE family transporter [Terriglobia bacterium]